MASDAAGMVGTRLLCRPGRPFERVGRADQEGLSQARPRSAPGCQPAGPRAEDRFKTVSEAHAVLSDPVKRKDYDEARRLFTAGPFDRTRFHPGERSAGVSGDFDFGNLFARGSTSSTAGGGIGDLFNRAGNRTTGTRPRRGSDVETDTRLPFRDAVRGVVVPLQ